MSDSLHHLLVVFTAYAIAAGSPGPSTLRIMGAAMSHGRQAALALAAGVVSGSLFWGVMAATGISAILAGCAILSVTIFCGYAVVFSTVPMVRLYRRARHWIEGVLAVFFGVAGLRLLPLRV